ncbi:MAG: PIN domain-containing protein [Acidimicrobiia bacterium]|nr:PIN domain-containing protein [Acidimicrobiia bacterium]
MIFVDTNVWMYAVGGAHPLRDETRNALEEMVDRRTAIATSAEVLQELLHAYLPVGRTETLDAALELATNLSEVWALTSDDIARSRRLHAEHPGLSSRDLTHLAVCLGNRATGLLTYDRALASAFDRL